MCLDMCNFGMIPTENSMFSFFCGILQDVPLPGFQPDAASTRHAEGVARQQLPEESH